MHRIDNMFKSLRARGETAFIPFSMAGYPDEKQSLEVFREICKSGCDLLEFGFPFSDPVADGPVIQKASNVAIRNGMTVEKALNMVARLREETETPIIFFTYFNPIHRYGTERFVEKAKECGLDGVLVVDVPRRS